MQARPEWSYAVVRIVATDAWVPVDDADDVAAFEADAAFEVHRAPTPGAFRPMLEHPHDGAVRATRELLGMMPLAHFRATLAALLGSPAAAAPQPQPARPGRQPG